MEHLLLYYLNPKKKKSHFICTMTDGLCNGQDSQVMTSMWMLLYTKIVWFIYFCSFQSNISNSFLYKLSSQKNFYIVSE